MNLRSPAKGGEQEGSGLPLEEPSPSLVFRAPLTSALCLLPVSGVDTSQAPALPSLSPSSSLSPCSEARVTQFIRQFVASSLLVSDSNTELSYVLPSEAVRKGCFQRLFQVPAVQMLAFS